MYIYCGIFFKNQTKNFFLIILYFAYAFCILRIIISNLKQTDWGVLVV